MFDQLTEMQSNFAAQVQKKPDKFSEELLSDGTEEADSGFWQSLTRYKNKRQNQSLMLSLTR